MNIDFTLEKYDSLCQAIIESGYEVWTIARYLTTEERPKYVIILRHDIDRRLDNALRMAQLEYEKGLQATYYARTTSAVFRPKVLKQITEMQHEVGYHYETLARAKGNMGKALTLFEKELADFRQFCQVQTISMHGAPLSPYDNRDLWRCYDFKQYGLLGEAYLSLDYNQLTYLTDTGRSWAGGRYNVRDRVQSSKTDFQHLKNTDDVIKAINEGCFSHVCISTHPERWSQGIFEWGLSAATDFAANQVKRSLIILRSIRK